MLVGGTIVATAADQTAALAELARHAVAPGVELVTLILGAGHDPAALERFTALMATEHPAVEVVTMDGGQPLYPYLASIE